ncbi:MAG: hypothetical protein P8176_12540 [Gammaproteobacteria bacterium]
MSHNILLRYHLLLLWVQQNRHRQSQQSRHVPGGRDQDKLPIERGYVLNAENTLRRHVINRLMCQFHLDIAALNTQFGIDFFTHFALEIAALKTLQGDGLLSFSPATLFTRTQRSHRTITFCSPCAKLLRDTPYFEIREKGAHSMKVAQRQSDHAGPAEHSCAFPGC